MKGGTQATIRQNITLVSMILSGSSKKNIEGESKPRSITWSSKRPSTPFSSKSHQTAKENSLMIHHQKRVHPQSVPSGTEYKVLHITLLVLTASNQAIELVTVGLGPKTNAPTVVFSITRLKIVGSQGEKATKATEIQQRELKRRV